MTTPIDPDVPTYTVYNSETDEFRDMTAEERSEVDARHSAWLARITLEVDKPTIVANGTDFATVTYKNGQANAPASVNFNVNGAVTAVPLSAGSAILEVTSTATGLIEISVDSDLVSLVAE